MPNTGLRVHYWLAWAVAIGVAVQVFLAGLGIFGGRLGDLSTEADERNHLSSTSTLDAHRIIGSLVVLLIILLALSAFWARLKGRDRTLSLGTDAAFVGGLHALNALALLGIAVQLALRDRALLEGTASTADATRAGAAV
jgi:hypothetical protein